MLQVRISVVAAVLLTVGCGSLRANPCAVRGATYLASSVEISGNCGPIPSEVVNINPDGTVSGTPQESCASDNEQGCTATRTACKWSENGFNFTSTSEVTFSSDGSSASGLVTIGLSNASSSCLSTYQLSYVRQR